MTQLSENASALPDQVAKDETTLQSITEKEDAEKEAEFRKRMELEAAAFAPAITLETIQTKLEKAEERRASLHQAQPNLEKKLSKVQERKSSLEQKNLEHNTKLETILSNADLKREQAKSFKVQKI